MQYNLLWPFRLRICDTIVQLSHCIFTVGPNTLAHPRKTYCPFLKIKILSVLVYVAEQRPWFLHVKREKSGTVDQATAFHPEIKNSEREREREG